MAENVIDGALLQQAQFQHQPRKNNCANDASSSNFATNELSAAGATFLSAVIVNPLDVAKMINNGGWPSDDQEYYSILAGKIIHSEASIAPGVLATLTQIAHAELPWFPLPTLSGHSSEDSVQVSRRVPIVIPVSAAMALSALHLQLRYGEKSDGLVTCRDAVVPGSVMVRPDKKLDHAWMVYSSWKKNPTEPDCCEMCEAILTLLVELGRAKEQKKSRKI